MSRQLSFCPQQEYELIEYPGRVVNTDRMLSTLGGIVNISKVMYKKLFISGKRLINYHTGPG